MNAPPGTLLATGFVADDPEQGTIFPSAGGNSADPSVQAIYWRCIVVLFASARITNPGQRLALFSNVAVPVVDGIDLGSVLGRYGVEVRRVPLTARISPGRASSWGNVLYFFDIMAALAGEDPGLRFALTDSDVLVTASLAPLFATLDDRDFAGYVVEDTAPDENVNGLTRRDMDRIARETCAAGGGPAERQLVEHYGGELFATTPAAWRAHEDLFRPMVEAAVSGSGPAAGVLTEEHIFSIAFAGLPGRVARANGTIKRIWTSPRHNTAAPGDERLPLWHLPAEKRYGLQDLFRDLKLRDFPVEMDPEDFRKLAMRRCGVPAKGAAKLAHDGLRQVAAKLGLRR